MASRPRIALRVLGVPLIGDCTGPNHELSERLFATCLVKASPRASKLRLDGCHRIRSV
jgi:hypothetical protein